MKKLLLVICIITIFTLSLNALGTLRVESIKELPEMHMNLEVRDADGKFAPVLIVKTELKGLGFKNIGRPTKHAPIYNEKKNEYKFYLNDKQRVVEITHSEYEPLEVRFLADYNIEVHAQRVYEMVLAFDKEVVQVPVVITCNQSGAEIFVDGDPVGKTQNKMLTVNIGSGLRTIRIEKDGFATQERQEEISMNNNSFNFILTPAMPAAVTITSNPEGATVYIDNLKFGTTPAKSFFDTGTYPIRIEKENYETKNEQITITEPETKKNYKLTDIRATLTVKTRPNATVIFNGKDYKGGIDKHKLLPQTINFKIEQELCKTINEIYTLKKGENKVFTLYPEDISATLTVKTHPNATVIYNGRDYKGGIDKHKLLPQTINFKIEQELCKTIEETYTLKEGENKVFELYPKDISATLTVKTHLNATVIFNGISFKGGVSEYKISPQVLQITVEMPKAETITRIVALKAKTAKTLEIFPEVQTGTIQVMTNPINAIIELTGDAGEHYMETGKKTFTDMPVGTYELTVTADEYKTHKETFRLKADETITKQIILEEGIDVPANMIFVQGGTFQMGSNDGKSEEKPIHTVTVSDFFIGKYEVTQSEWKEIMGNRSFFYEGMFLPVESISWFDAVEFCNKKSDKEGLTRCYTGSGKNIKCDFSTNGYRLPTEAEWEYAARGGNSSKDYKYSGSNSIRDVTWYSDYSNSITHPVGGKKANELGIYDMSGNVWEWCNDWYDDNYYRESPMNNPQGPTNGKYRVLRGGGLSSNYKGCSMALRSSYTPDHGYGQGIIGIRIVRTP